VKSWTEDIGSIRNYDIQGVSLLEVSDSQLVQTMFKQYSVNISGGIAAAA
jgi:hypothetical protein